MQTSRCVRALGLVSLIALASGCTSFGPYHVRISLDESMTAGAKSAVVDVVGVNAVQRGQPRRSRQRRPENPRIRRGQGHQPDAAADGREVADLEVPRRPPSDALRRPSGRAHEPRAAAEQQGLAEAGSSGARRLSN